MAESFWLQVLTALEDLKIDANAQGSLYSGHSVDFLPSSEFISRQCGVCLIDENSY